MNNHILQLKIETTWFLDFVKRELFEFRIDCQKSGVQLRVRPVEVPRLLPEIAITVTGGVSVRF